MMIQELSQNGCDVLCKAGSYITALLTKTTVVEASKPLIEYLPFQIWQLESHQKGWNVKSASFLTHDPFIGGSMGPKRATPHPTPQETLAKLYVGALSPGSWLRPIREIMDPPLLQIFS